MRFCLLSLFLFPFAVFSQNPPADLVFRNGRIYTLQLPGHKVKALAVQGERIVYAGSKRGVKKWIGPATKVTNIKGKTVLPGFTDAHVHPVSGGLAFLECDLTGIQDADTILNRLARHARANPEKAWVRGENLWLPVFSQGNPHKNLLDRIVPDRPVFVSTADGHSAWVNSKALEMAGITRETRDPERGRIERDPATGEPSGTLREDAMGLVTRLIPPYTTEERKLALKKALHLANSLGLTNLVEASAGRELADTYLALEAAGELSAHVSISFYADVSKGKTGAQAVIRLNDAFRGVKSDVRFDQVKLFMDGVVEGKTAALSENYEGENHAGIPNAHPDSAKAMIEMLDRAGLQTHVHAIGDRGVRMTLDAFEHARRLNGVRDARHHIAHLHVVDPQDIDRFKSLDVAANFQALWATLEDTYMTDLNFPFLGKKRSDWQYPIGTMARSGARLVFGSDWPVSSMNPFEAMQVAVTRRGPDAERRPAWTPQHLADVQTVVEGYTRGGAYLTFRERETGVLETGKLADLIVLDGDFFKKSKFEIYKTKVEMTIFRGKIVWEASKE